MLGPLRAKWVHGGQRVERFSGRATELARLARWVGDTEVKLVGITAWGGAGKTTLATEWLTGDQDQLAARGIKGLFAWSFYEKHSSEEWASALLAWVAESWDIDIGSGSLEARVLRVLSNLDLVLVLDGLEVVQEGLAGKQYGRLLDGTLRAVIAGTCQLHHKGLVVMTSRFPFADVEQFDGAAARMLDVPPLTADEGADLLQYAGGGWLSLNDQRDLVSAVDGHALAVVVLAGALADRPPDEDLAQLRQRLHEAGRTDARVAKVLRFYADRLGETDRKLVAFVSMFPRPIPTTTILRLGSDDKVGAPLFGLDRSAVEAAVRQRLAGLLQWHSAGMVSAHPLVRDTFRPLVLTPGAAQLASTIALADVPAGDVRNRDDALRVVEMTELLLDANEWQAAYQLYEGRTRNGYLWLRMPAARLGQRCATAFVGTVERRRACAQELSMATMDFLLNEAAMYATLAGDAVSGSTLFQARVDTFSERSSGRSRSAALRNLSVALGALGDTERCVAAAEEGLELVRTAAGLPEVNAYAAAALAYDLAGATPDAERYFNAAEALQLRASGAGSHLHSLWGCAWARLLLRTRRSSPARRLTDANRTISRNQNRHQDVARCDHVLAICDLADGDVTSAEARLRRAVETFRLGDFLPEWAAALTDLAECHRLAERMEDSEQACIAAAHAAAPRELLPVHGLALIARGRVYADLFRSSNDRKDADRARDYAEHARRLATRRRRLPWLELGALEVLALLENRGSLPGGDSLGMTAPDAWTELEEIDGSGSRWQDAAEQLRSVLVPEDLDADPLRTAEKLVAERSSE